MANSMAGGSIDTNNYLTIYALEDGLTASLSTNACEYCVDGNGNWKSLAAGTATESINTGRRLSFRGKLTPNSLNGIGTFTISKKCNLEGNCMSILFGDDAVNNLSLSGKDYAFYKLFYTCANIVSVSANFLPATALASSCYMDMFYYCNGLTAAPELPATTLTNSCYSGMFNRCFSLTTAPELPATTLIKYCYYEMFTNCSKLNYIKMLATDISVVKCLFNWVSGVASTGTFVKNPNMTSLPTGISGIPSGWTVVNDGVNLITFSIDGGHWASGYTSTYQAEDGMTWSEWIDSDYNTNGLISVGNEIRTSSGAYAIIGIGIGDTIIADEIYFISYGAGGGSD